MGRPPSAPLARRRVRLRIEGTVQGVGFRPYVYRLATELGIAGFVLNDELGVLVEAEGSESSIELFLERLPAEAPPLATVERVTARELVPAGEAGFDIVQSEGGGEPAALVSPDVAVCEDCLRELRDPQDRRYRYPFINCTNCGPRFTIVRAVPYDRPFTTMAAFKMCASCQAEYDDPGDRRFHAQPNACPECGPALMLLDSGGREIETPDPLGAVATALASGLIVAVKGVGGYHLACHADDEAAVAKLRGRKRREEKPFALMAPTVAAARRLVELTPAEEALLTGRERPIVIARRRRGAPAAASVAPHSADLGVMLPYSPLHHLLVEDAGTTLVMTSGNVSDEPIAYEDGEAVRRLGAIADLFLVHNRPIHTRTDDSVVRSVGGAGGRPLMLRRSRGYVPASVNLPVEARRPITAYGAELKSTFCVAKGRRAWVGHHIGDLKNWETLHSFREGVAHFEALFAVEPEVAVHDLHPDYLSTKEALERAGVELVGVQHHHAHLAACLAEHGQVAPAVGAIFDGTGYGTDGTVWGGELLVGGLEGFKRAGHLLPVRLPGGDQAIREPWRMACAWLAEASGTDSPEPPRKLAQHIDRDRWTKVADIARAGVSSPITTSMGRLFDAIAALCGVRTTVTYEGQAAVELEALADRDELRAYPLPVVPRGDGLLLDARETVRAVLGDLENDAHPGLIAACFHNAVAEATAHACAHLAEASELDTVVLSGGVFQNRLLLERTVPALQARGLRVLVPERLPPNDGSIAYGQVAVAAATRAR
jgi:hydrogenase maturation protein HypF